MTPRYSVIVPNLNGRAFLETCFASLEACRYPDTGVEWLLVDNGSVDDSVDLVQRRFPRTRVVALPENRGFTGGIDAGVEAARGEYLVFLNNDMRVAEDWLAGFDAVLGPDNPCATGLIRSGDGQRVDFLEGLLLFDGGALQRADGAALAGLSLHAGPRFIACGGNMAIGRELYQSLGGFDPAFFAYGEDVDLSWRLHAAGHSIRFAPQAAVNHYRQGTSDRLGEARREFLYKRNAFATLFKNIDEPLFAAFLQSAWLTLVHRTREIIRLKAPGAEALDEWLGEAAAPPRAPGAPQGSLARFRALLRMGARRGWQAALSRALIRLGEDLSPAPPARDGLPAMDLGHPLVQAQLRLIWDITANLDELLARRRAAQRLRRVPDRELFQRFPPWVVPVYPGDEMLFDSAAFRALLPATVDFRHASLAEVQEPP